MHPLAHPPAFAASFHHRCQMLNLKFAFTTFSPVVANIVLPPKSLELLQEFIYFMLEIIKDVKDLLSTVLLERALSYIGFCD